MRRVGFFAELGDGPMYDGGSIADHLGHLDEGIARRAAEYLRNGHGLVDIMEGTRDVVSGDTYVSGGPSLKTDGEYLWREDLAHYVERHRVGLPPELRERMAALDYEVPSLAEDELDALSEEAMTVWLGDSWRERRDRRGDQTP